MLERLPFSLSPQAQSGKNFWSGDLVEHHWMTERSDNFVLCWVGKTSLNDQMPWCDMVSCLNVTAWLSGERVKTHTDRTEGVERADMKTSMRFFQTSLSINVSYYIWYLASLDILLFLYIYNTHGSWRPVKWKKRPKNSENLIKSKKSKRLRKCKS